MTILTPADHDSFPSVCCYVRPMAWHHHCLACLGRGAAAAAAESYTGGKV